MLSMIIGSVGVGMLLLAFALNVSKRLSEQSSIYLLLNLFGAGLAAWYAFDEKLYPFVILETVWALFALIKLIQSNIVHK